MLNRTSNNRNIQQPCHVDEFKVYIEDLLKRLSIIMRRLKNAEREFTKIYNFLLEKKQVDVELVN